MVRRIALVAALVVVGTTSVNAQALIPDPIVTVYQLSQPIVNRQGDTMNYVAIAADNQRTYWNNVPQGMQLSPGLVAPPRTTFSRSNIIVQRGWKHSIDTNSGLVAGSVPLNPAMTTVATTTPANSQGLTPDPVVSIYRLSYPVVNRQGDTMNYVAIAADNQRTYWNNVPQGMQLSPGLVAPPATTFSRTPVVVQNGWKHSIDANSGLVAASIPLTQTTTTAKIPLQDAAPEPAPAPIPADPQQVR